MKSQPPSQVALGFGHWVVSERDAGRFVGEVGFANCRRDNTPPLGDAPEIGWVLVPMASGRATRGALLWGDHQFAGGRAVCIMEPDHARSRRVADMVGFRPGFSGLYRGHEILVVPR